MSRIVYEKGNDIMDGTPTSYETETTESDDSIISFFSDSSGATSVGSWAGAGSPTTSEYSTDDINELLEDGDETDDSSETSLTETTSQDRMENEQESTASEPETVEPPSEESNVDTNTDAETNYESNEPTDETGEPPAKVRKISSPTPNDDQGDGETCPICLDAWGNSGDHRLVALKCGHLFGSKCVERWIRGKGSKDRCCPTCKTKAAVKDIRYIYARRLVAVDTTELVALQKQVETVQMEKTKLEMDLHTTKMEHRSLELQLDLLKKTLATSQTSRQQPRRTWRFALDKNLEIWRDGGCRVLAFNCRTYDFYVSQKTTNTIFPGYGVRTVNCVDYKLGQFIHLHPKAIRDVAYSQPTDLLMSVSLDSTARIVERGIQTTVVQCGVPLWSCAWDHIRPNHFYVGGMGGLVVQYDVRNTGRRLNTFLLQSDLSPIVSLSSTEFGLLSCQLNSCWLWNTSLPSEQPLKVPLKGPFMSQCYDHETQQAVVSIRSGSTERARLALLKIKKNLVDGEVTFDLRQSIPSSTRSTLMTRASWVKCPDASWVAAYSESDSSLFLHSVEGGRSMSLPAAEAALDVCAGQVNGDTILAALSESRLRLYKAVATNS